MRVLNSDISNTCANEKIFKMSTKRHLTVIKIQAKLESREELPIRDIS